MRLIRAVLAVVMVASLATVSLAAKPKPEGKPKKSAEERFEKADKDGDKKLSLEEFVGKRTDDKKAKATSKFEKLDKDGDKSLSLEEFKAAGKKK